MLLINKYKAKESTLMEERGLLTIKRRRKRKKGTREPGREGFDGLDK